MGWCLYYVATFRISGAFQKRIDNFAACYKQQDSVGYDRSGCHLCFVNHSWIYFGGGRMQTRRWITAAAAEGWTGIGTVIAVVWSGGNDDPKGRVKVCLLEDPLIEIDSETRQ